MRVPIGSSIVLATLLAALSGCTMGGSGPRGASAVQDPVISDIPKPAGFKLVADRSVFWQSGKFRGGKCEYSGRTDLLTVKNFYREYMPQAGFEEREFTLYKGTFQMRFESQDEICNIRIQTEGRKTVVAVEMAPRARGSIQTEFREPLLRNP